MKTQLEKMLLRLLSDAYRNELLTCAMLFFRQKKKSPDRPSGPAARSDLLINNSFTLTYLWDCGKSCKKLEKSANGVEKAGKK